MYPAFLSLGYTEILIILAVAVLLFGGRTPEVARNIGRWFYDIKGGMNKLNRDIYAPPPPKPPKTNASSPEHMAPYIPGDADLDRDPYDYEELEEDEKTGGSEDAAKDAGQEAEDAGAADEDASGKASGKASEEIEEPKTPMG